jgi:sortase A
MLRGKRRAVITALSVAAIAGAIAITAQIGFFMLRSSTGGDALIHTERGLIAAAGHRPAGCQTGNHLGPGLLEAPSIGLTAPVVQGTTDQVLDVAVGHVPGSTWPGPAGTSVLSAHDITWFSGIDRLRPGDQVRYVTPCTTYTYQVASYAVVSAGTPVYTSSASRLVLDTCYPLDALYPTTTRYLVYANLTATSATNPEPAAPASWPVPAVPAPAALTAQNLDLDHNYAPLGTLSITGSPAPAWTESSAPMEFEAAALTEYFGLLHSAAQYRQDWWDDLAPRVPMPAALRGAGISEYYSRLLITLRAEDTRPVGAVLTADVSLGGGGMSAITVTEAVTGGKLQATKVSATQGGA